MDFSGAETGGHPRIISILKSEEGCPTQELNCKEYIQISRRNVMPYITIESGALTDEQKSLLIKRLTEVSSEIMKVPQEFFVTTIKEVSDKNFGIGGKTIDIVKSEYKKKHQG
jgi:4-oxalocrotonate tautomerase